MTEGSVEVDGGVAPTVSTPDPVTPVVEPVTPAKETPAEALAPQTETVEGETPETDEPKLTEKGTKLDPNPESAVHQELANAKRELDQYKTVLRSPELLKQFAKEAGYTLEEAKEAIKEEIYSADKLQTTDDYAKALNQIRQEAMEGKSGLDKEVKELKRELEDLRAGRQVERVTVTLQSDVAAVREKYPELDPKSPEYDPDLEKEIGDTYAELDRDEKTGLMKGNHSILKIADRMMRVAGRGKKKGSEKAQTTVTEKVAGKVVTSDKQPKSEEPTTIAQRIAKAYKR